MERHIQTMLAYNSWANARVLDAAARLTEHEYNEPLPGLVQGSIRGALVHVYAAEHVWRVRWAEGISPTALPWEDDLPTLHDLREVWAVEQEKWDVLTASLTSAELEKDIHYKTTGGTEWATPLWQILLHVVNHGTQFRSEATVALKAAGFYPGDINTMAFLRR